MKIWYNPTSLSRLCNEPDQGNQWPDDWDDWADRSVSSVYASQAPKLTLSTSIRTQAYDDAHWVMSSPAEPGLIALLDEHAAQVLQQFRQPMTMIEALRQAGKGRALSVMRAVQHFVALGLLRHVQANEVQPGIIQEQNIAIPLSEAVRQEATRILQQGQLVAF